ncbi:hypothetical protein JRO89_XS05G0033700 [Xanthoceras sorbifolium]|uniref:Retrovirus-related Pol polyprotein from transposon TNT 1-94-like beta-barrel domain-containing protein n=1 Tax=Xanthoceras sorbifolium TaxID=99658 RepID=A0ABQ8I0A6_9ROSI|nr:hypothetical protein JRO89_XS05G0033700 [Xanthoceras sorbifolium]
MTNSNPTVASSSSSSAPQVTLMGTTNNNTNQSPSLIAINSTQVLIKLTKGGNYAAWRSQFENLLFGYDLIGYLDVNDGAIVIHTLNGLGSAYMSLASAIHARDTPITFEELYEKLLDHEAYLRRDESKKNGPTILFSLINGNNRGINHNHNSTYRTHNQSNSAPQNQQWCTQFSHTSTRPICQLCDKVGHTARTCRSCPSPTAQPWPQANHLTSDQPGSHNANNWILDSGASHHMTSDLQNLSLHSEYGGPENIMLGDSKTIPITHTGSTFDYGGILGLRPE